jgi:peptide/nickel transport system permease protein
VTRFVCTRILDMIPVLLGVSIASFLVIHLVPGDPARVLLGINATPEAVAGLRHQLGLDRPLPTQYWDYITDAVRLDFGMPVKGSDSVAELIGRRLQASFFLAGYTVLLTVLIAVPLATIAAARRNGLVDQAIRLLTTLTFVMPAFWLGLLLIEVVSLQLGLLPTSGYGDTMVEHVESLTLPALTTALWLAPLVLRQLRSNMIEVMQAEYVEAARARGLSPARVMFKHVLRNSVMSTVTLLGIIGGVMLSLIVVVENVFAIPGLGSLLVSSVDSRDFPVVQALTLLFGVVVVLSSLVTDVIYAILDPRVRL